MLHVCVGKTLEVQLNLSGFSLLSYLAECGGGGMDARGKGGGAVDSVSLVVRILCGQ